MSKPGDNGNLYNVFRKNMRVTYFRFFQLSKTFILLKIFICCSTWFTLAVKLLILLSGLKIWPLRKKDLILSMIVIY